MEKDENATNIQNNNNVNTSSEIIDNQITIDDIKEIVNSTDEPNESTEPNESEEIHKKKLINEEIQKINQQNLKRYVNLKENSNEINNNNQKNRQEEKEKCKFAKFKGRTLFLFLDKLGNPLFIIGPHWAMYVCFCGIISLLMSLIYFYFWKNLGSIMRISGIIIFWTYFISYSYTSLINPGYPKNTEGRKNGIPKQDYYYCERCRFYVRKQSYATHCYECDICIENQDHHCPWTGHCIGKNNLWSFYIFIGSSFVVIVYLACALCVGSSKK